MAAQVSGSTAATWIRMATEAREARAEKTRTWPTFLTIRGVRVEPARKPR
jgi:hypothetical protein